ncbi:MAG: hypothetical protein AAFP17_01790 [Pseudomonadota bacterium]
MLWKIAFTAAVIVIVFLLGQRSARGRVNDAGKRVPPRRRIGLGTRRRRATGPMTDLVRCPDCGSYHSPTDRCRCRD